MARKPKPEPTPEPRNAVHMGRTQTILQNLLDACGERYLTPNDLSVRDAQETYPLYVKDKDIARARCGDGGDCVAAQACKRGTDADAVWVTHKYTWVLFERTSRTVYRYKNSPAMLSKVVIPLDTNDYDNIEAGMYLLTPPKGSERLGEGARRKQKSRASGERKVAKRRNRSVSPTSTMRVTRKPR
jgi:hypothetical protein